MVWMRRYRGIYRVLAVPKIGARELFDNYCTRGRVPSYSGTFVDLREGPEAPHGAYAYPEHFFPDIPVKPIRIWMHVSQNDIGATSASADRRNWVIANQRLAAVLNAGHIDAKVIHQALP